jgi:DNA-binding response OmpR family regulator
VIILLAGNDADLLFVLSYALRGHGYEIIGAPPGEMATARSRTGEGPALIIVDEDGQSREIPTPPVPHILLTARAVDPAAGGSLGWAAVVPKPFLVAALVRIIEALRVHGDAQALDGAEQPSQTDIH